MLNVYVLEKAYKCELYVSGVFTSSRAAKLAAEADYPRKLTWQPDEIDFDEIARDEDNHPRYFLKKWEVRD